MKLSEKKKQAAYAAIAEQVDRLRVKLKMAREERRNVALLAEDELRFLTIHIWDELKEALNLE